MLPPYKVVIIDDDDLNIQLIKKQLSKYSIFEVIGIASNAPTGNCLITTLQPDLVFVDIQLVSTKSGLEFYRTLQNKIFWSMQVILCSHNTNVTSVAIKQNLFGLIIKPLQKIEFEFIITKYLSFKNDEVEEHKKQLKQYENLKTNSTSIHIASTTSVYILPLNSIGYCFYDNKSSPERWFIVETDKKKVPLKRKTNAETILATSSNFAQINKHLIINRDYLSKITNNKCLMLYPFNNEIVSFRITRRFLDLLRKSYISL